MEKIIDFFTNLSEGCPCHLKEAMVDGWLDPIFWHGVYFACLIALIVLAFTMIIVILFRLRKPSFPGICYQYDQSSVTITNQALKSLVREKLKSIKGIEAGKISFSYDQSILTVTITLLLISLRPSIEVKEEVQHLIEESFSSIGIKEKILINLSIADFVTNDEENIPS